jgi:hypothetical protein
MGTVAVGQPKNNIYYRPGSRIAAEWQVGLESTVAVAADVPTRRAEGETRPRDSRPEAGATWLRGAIGPELAPIGLTSGSRNAC